MNYKVSVIVPIFNCEKYIKFCLESILNQSYKNIEVILVNDGSTDKTLSIINDIEKKDSRIIIINKENGGVSSARNLGLENATGDFVLFVDADDYIENKCIEKCMEYIKLNDLDIIKFGFVKELTKKVEKKYKFSVDLNVVINRDEYSKKLYPYIFSSNDFCNITNTIIRKDIIENNLFPINILLGEDYLFFINCLNNSKNIYFINDPFYHYVVNEQSATHFFDFDKNIKKLSDSIFVNFEIKKLLLIENFSELNYFISKCDYSLYSNIIICISNCNYSSFCKYINKIYENQYLNKKIGDLFPHLSKKTKLLLQKNLIIFYIFKIKCLFKSIIKKFVLLLK